VERDRPDVLREVPVRAETAEPRVRPVEVRPVEELPRVEPVRAEGVEEALLLDPLLLELPRADGTELDGAGLAAMPQVSQ
jgi:hypothetical protein